MPLCRAKQVLRSICRTTHEEAFRMKHYTREMVRRRKRRIDYRLRDRRWKAQEKPMLSASNIQYEMGDRLRGTAGGGIGMMYLLARGKGLIECIDVEVEGLKRHLGHYRS